MVIKCILIINTLSARLTNVFIQQDYLIKIKTVLIIINQQNTIAQVGLYYNSTMPLENNFSIRGPVWPVWPSAAQALHTKQPFLSSRMCRTSQRAGLSFEMKQWPRPNPVFLALAANYYSSFIIWILKTLLLSEFRHRVEKIVQR